MQALVVDADLKAVPMGAFGELIVGGDGVAVGYRNLPELSASRFVTADFGDGPQRYYRTGDTVRLLEDGNIQYVGRLDNQVKIRGFRIELGEIEEQLNQITGVQQSCVFVQGTGCREDPACLCYPRR